MAASWSLKVHIGVNHTVNLWERKIAADARVISTSVKE